MLVSTPLRNTPSVQRLIQIWTQRYTPNLSTSDLPNSKVLLSELVEASTPEGRAITATKLDNTLIGIKCQMAELQAQSLYTYIPNIVNLSESKQLAHFAFLIYQELGRFYRKPHLSSPSLYPVISPEKLDSLSSWGMPSIDKLAIVLEPLFLEFQSQHIAAKNWRTLGFITTLLNFSNQLILSKLLESRLKSRRLTTAEQILISPYFKFIEEQVALPYQRVCAAAAHHEIGTPALTLVEQMLPQSAEIARTVYSRLVQHLPHHRSRRGGLNDAGITHSCVRDLEMFQAYLWLCILEGSLVPIEQELVDLCVMVMTGVEVKWEMTELWNKLLAEELLARVKPEQKSLLRPYTEGLQQAFLKQRDYFFIPADATSKAASLKGQNPSELPSQRSFYFPSQYRQPSR